MLAQVCATGHVGMYVPLERGKYKKICLRFRLLLQMPIDSFLHLFVLYFRGCNSEALKHYMLRIAKKIPVCKKFDAESTNKLTSWSALYVLVEIK